MFYRLSFNYVIFSDAREFLNLITLGYQVWVYEYLMSEVLITKSFNKMYTNYSDDSENTECEVFIALLSN